MFINFTQHALTPEQRAQAFRLVTGEHSPIETSEVIAEMRDLQPAVFNRLAQMTGAEDVQALAEEVADLLVEEYSDDVIHLPIGTPAFMFALAVELSKHTFPPRVVFSFSRRESVDVPQDDGSVRKQAVFTFERFIIFGAAAE